MSNDSNTTVPEQHSSLTLAVIALIASIGTIGANSLALGPIATAIANDYFSDVIVVMQAAAAYGLSTALAALTLSPLIDRAGVRRVLMFSLGFSAIAFAASATATSVTVFIATQAFAGLAAGVALPAIYAFCAQIAPAGKESEVLGRVLTGWTISLVVGVSFATVIADTVGWRWVYASFCALTVLALTLLFFVTDTSTDSETHSTSQATGQAANQATILAKKPVASQTTNKITSKITWPLSTLFIPGVSFLLCMCFVFMCAFYGVYGYLGAHVNTDLGLPVKTNGLFAISYGIGFGLAALGDKAIGRVGRERALPWTFAIIMLIYIAIGVSSASFNLLLAMTFFWGAFNHFAVNLIVAGLSAINASLRGAILGAYSATTYVAASAGALGFGWVYETYGFVQVAFLAAFLLLIASALSSIRFKKTVHLN